MYFFYDIDLKNILISNIIILIFIVIIELFFVNTISKNNISIDPNYVKKLLINNIQTFAE